MWDISCKNTGKTLEMYPDVGLLVKNLGGMREACGKSYDYHEYEWVKGVEEENRINVYGAPPPEYTLSGGYRAGAAGGSVEGPPRARLLPRPERERKGCWRCP
jgi:hypothetical protein